MTRAMPPCRTTASFPCGYPLALTAQAGKASLSDLRIAEITVPGQDQHPFTERDEQQVRVVPDDLEQRRHVPGTEMTAFVRGEPGAF